MKVEIQLRNVVNPISNVCGEVIIYNEPVSYLGDLDPEKGYVRNVGYINNKIFLYRGGTGSTVGSYILYGLSITKKKPKALIVKSLDIVTLVGAILAEIPLYVIIKEKKNIGIFGTSIPTEGYGCINNEVLTIEL